MVVFEVILSILAVIVILYLGRVGASFGLFFEMTSAVLFTFAMLVTMRYWYHATQIFNSIVPVGPAYSAFWGFLLLFILGCIPLIAVMKSVNEDARPKYPNLLDTILGFVFGTISAAVVVCCVFTLVSVLLPKAWKDYDPNALFFRLDQYPIQVYQFVEQDVFGVTDKDPGHTRLPTLEKGDLDDFEKYWR